MTRFLTLFTFLVLCFASTTAAQSIDYSVVEDEFDGKRTEVIAVEAVEASPSRMTGLALYCYADGDLIVSLLVGSYVIGDSDDDIYTRYKFDNETPTDKYYWRVVTNTTGHAVVTYDGHEDFIIEKLLSSSTLTLRTVDPYDYEEFTDHYDLTGFRQAYNKIKGCQNDRS